MAFQISQTFLNLPVTDLKRSIAFFEALGFAFNPQFTDDNAACLVLSDTAYAMLLTESYFQTFIKKDIANAAKTTEFIMAVSVSSKEEVQTLVRKALASGGSASNDPQDHGFMYTESFQDPDGHLWEVFHMDASYVQES
ncbi:VOC family protein [Cohnella sp. 56]|uniref:VOC family protein n=1 Tax=Cohnella sp. 56 TaxID=3113722 RepID=UPI0030EAB1E4